MNPFDYYLTAFKDKYADFEGRSRRSEYWYFALFNLLVSIGLLVIDSVLGFGILYFVYILVSFIPNLSVSVRRLHDTNRSGWNLLISFIPLVGTIILIVWLATEGTAGPNEYGDDPKNPDIQDDIIAHLVD